MCNYHQIQSNLEKRYQQFHKSANFDTSLIQRLSPPLLVSVFENWIKSQYKIIVVGQETTGWGFKGHPCYKWPYGFQIQNFQEFKNVANPQLAVEALVHFYREFGFARHQPLIYNSPFWRAYKQLRENLENNLDQSILWTNVFRMSVDGGMVMRKDMHEEIQSIYSNTSGLLLDEISILNPKVVIFFTGPNYEEAIKQQFPDVDFKRFQGYELYEVARLTHQNLPKCTIRTYHPKYLRLSRKWKLLTDIETFIRNNAPCD